MIKIKIARIVIVAGALLLAALAGAVIPRAGNQVTPAPASTGITCGWAFCAVAVIVAVTGLVAWLVSRNNPLW
ncbi:MAG: hypothetical protein JXA14_26235 [Anaerolineae bacterium]|nr:hypothetical protein [Anaerolineae bacterium]